MSGSVVESKLHARLQVVNRTEVEAMIGGGVPFFAINLAVGISLAIPGFQSDIAKGLLHALPQARRQFPFWPDSCMHVLLACRGALHPWTISCT